jgi:hypothetical protein
MKTLMNLFMGDGHFFCKLNRALITLIPKNFDAEELGDYKPLSLLDSFAKLFSKLLANL